MEEKTLTLEEMSAKVEELEKEHNALKEENASLKKANEDLQSKVTSLKITGLTQKVDTSVKVEQPEEVQFDFDV